MNQQSGAEVPAVPRTAAAQRSHWQGAHSLVVRGQQKAVGTAANAVHLHPGVGRWECWSALPCLLIFQKNLKSGFR